MALSPVNRAERSYHYALGLKFEHFEVECIPDALEMNLPFLFSAQHRHQVPESVEVSCVKRGCDVFLAQGWRQVGRCLGLNGGGWLKMIYVTFDRFFIEPHDRLNNTPFCPAPPRILRLHAEPKLVTAADGMNNFVDPSIYVGRKPTVVMTFYGSLQVSDITTSFLHIPSEFCDVVYPRADCEVTLVDQNGKAWPCALVFPSNCSHSDVILRGWGAVVDANDIVEGFAYKLEIPVDTTNLIFFSGH